MHLQTHELAPSEQESREKEKSRARENMLLTLPPPRTTRLTAGTDWQLCHPQFSREAPPPPSLPQQSQQTACLEIQPLARVEAPKPAAQFL